MAQSFPYIPFSLGSHDHNLLYLFWVAKEKKDQFEFLKIT